MERAAGDRRPPPPISPGELAGAGQGEHGLLHEAGEVVDGAQRCRRCGLDLPLSPHGRGFRVEGFVEHVQTGDGQRMSWVGSADASAFPLCGDGAPTREAAGGG